MASNFFQNLLKGITRPVRDIAELGNIVQTSSQVQRGVPTTKSGFQQLRQYQPKYTDMQEATALTQRPILQGAKDVASVGSLLVPAGQGVRGLATSGAVAGGLGGFGGSQMGQEAQGALGGAAMGGALGGLLGLAQKGLGKLGQSAKGASQKADRAVLNDITEKATKLKPKELDKAKDLFINEYRSLYGDKLGINKIDLANAKDDIVASLSSKIDDYATTQIPNAKQSIIEQARNRVDMGLLNSIANKEKGGKALRDILQSVDALPDSPSLGQIREVTQKVDGLLKYGKEGVTTTGVQNINRELDSLRKILRGETAKVGMADAALKDLSKVIKVADEFESIVSKRPGISVAGTNIPIPRGVSQGIESGVTGVTQAVSRIPETPNLPTQALQSLLAGIAQTPQEPQAALEMETGVAMPQAQASSGMDFVTALGMASQIFPNASESELLSLAGELQKQYGGSATGGLITVQDIVSGAVPDAKLTDNDKDYVQARLALEDALNYVETEGGAGKLSTIGGGIAGFFGQKTSSSQYRAKVQNAVATLRKALIGAGQTEAEMKNLNLPKPTDEPALAAEKIRAIIDDISRRPVGAGQTVVTQ